MVYDLAVVNTCVASVGGSVSLIMISLLMHVVINCNRKLDKYMPIHLTVKTFE